MILHQATKAYIDKNYSFYEPWIHDDPIVISKDLNDNFVKLHTLLHKLIKSFVLNYEEFKHLMPISKESHNLISLYKNKPYEVGTFRTDFLFDKTKQAKIIEISCRCPLNALFYTSFLEKHAEMYVINKSFSNTFQNPYNKTLPYLSTFLKNTKRVVVLTGDDTQNESRLYIPIFENMGVKVHKFFYTEADKNSELFNNAWVISELSQAELLSLRKETIVSLIKNNVLNDLRTVFLIHDKRFFSVLSNEHFLNTYLSLDEKEFFSQYLISSLNYTNNPEMWNLAKRDKDRWVLKPRNLGNAEHIYAGKLVDQDEWEQHLDSKTENWLLQEWVDSNPIKGTIANKTYSDYATGTLLFFNEHYFGLGPFRLSSYPVINTVDDRKASYLIKNS